MSYQIELEVATILAMAEGEKRSLREVIQEVMESLRLQEWKPVSNAIRKMKTDGVVGTLRNGKHFIIWAEPSLEEWVKVRIQPARSLPARRVSKSAKVSKEEWAEYMKAFHEGTMEMAFIPAEASVVAYKLDGETRKVGYGRPAHD